VAEGGGLLKHLPPSPHILFRPEKAWFLRLPGGARSVTSRLVSSDPEALGAKLGTNYSPFSMTAAISRAAS
jgi:hypothetical protein